LFQWMSVKKKSVLINRSIGVVEVFLGCAPHKIVGYKTKAFYWSQLRRDAKNYSSLNAACKKEMVQLLWFVKFLIKNQSLGVLVSKNRFESDFDWFVRNVSVHRMSNLYLASRMLRAHVELDSTYGQLSPFRRVELFIESTAVVSYRRYLKSVGPNFKVMDMIKI
jgi:hypothetical protein